MNPRVGYIALAIVLIVAMGRTVLATQASLVRRDEGGTALAGRFTDPMLSRLAADDSLLSSLARNRRDPFRPWNPVSSAPAVRTTPAEPEPPPLVPPRVVVYMQDGTSTIVQFEVDGDTSPRLAVGGSFRGWTITGISGRTVSLSKNGQQFAVPRP
jgi:hypothetical protein